MQTEPAYVAPRKRLQRVFSAAQQRQYDGCCFDRPSPGLERCRLLPLRVIQQRDDVWTINAKYWCETAVPSLQSKKDHVGINFSVLDSIKRGWRTIKLLLKSRKRQVDGKQSSEHLVIAHALDLMIEMAEDLRLIYHWRCWYEVSRHLTNWKTSLWLFAVFTPIGTAIVRCAKSIALNPASSQIVFFDYRW